MRPGWPVAARCSIVSWRSAGLGDKLGALLVQLPPKFAFDEDVSDRFLRGLRARIGTPVAFEPRHASWFASGVDDWLAKRRVARAATYPALVAGADKPGAGVA